MLQRTTSLLSLGHQSERIFRHLSSLMTFWSWCQLIDEELLNYFHKLLTLVAQLAVTGDIVGMVRVLAVTLIFCSIGKLNELTGGAPLVAGNVRFTATVCSYQVGRDLITLLQKLWELPSRPWDRLVPPCWFLSHQMLEGSENVVVTCCWFLVPQWRAQMQCGSTLRQEVCLWEKAPIWATRNICSGPNTPFQAICTPEKSYNFDALHLRHTKNSPRQSHPTMKTGLLCQNSRPWHLNSAYCQLVTFWFSKPLMHMQTVSSLMHVHLLGQSYL